MTRNEITTALTCCHSSDCGHCPLVTERTVDDCTRKLSGEVLDLIPWIEHEAVDKFIETLLEIAKTTRHSRTIHSIVETALETLIEKTEDIV